MARFGTLASNWSNPYRVGDADIGRRVKYSMHAYGKSLKPPRSNGVQASDRALVQIFYRLVYGLPLNEVTGPSVLPGEYLGAILLLYPKGPRPAPGASAASTLHRPTMKGSWAMRNCRRDE